MSWKKSDTGDGGAPPTDVPGDQPRRASSGDSDDAQMREHMEETDRRAADAERLANQQRALVASLERGGNDAAEARRLLRILEERLALEEAERDRMRRELAALRRREV